MRITVVIAAILVAAPALGTDWICTNGSCEAVQPVDIAELSGSFAGAESVSEGDNPDHYAAMEQQRWREFRFVLTGDARVHIEVTVSAGTIPENWPAETSLQPSVNVSLHNSADGEHYQRVENGALLRAMTQLSVLLVQQTETLGDGALRYHAGNFALSVRATPVVAAGTHADGPIAAPMIAASDGPALGCAPERCFPQLQTTSITAVGGSPDIADLPATDRSEPPAETSRNGANALASELQTELTRLGCYSAAVDGLWGPASRRAMAAFNAAIGATLPQDAATPKALVAAARESEPVCSDP